MRMFYVSVSCGFTFVSVISLCPFVHFVHFRICLYPTISFLDFILFPSDTDSRCPIHSLPGTENFIYYSRDQPMEYVGSRVCLSRENKHSLRNGSRRCLTIFVFSEDSPSQLRLAVKNALAAAGCGGIGYYVCHPCGGRPTPVADRDLCRAVTGFVAAEDRGAALKNERKQFFEWRALSPQMRAVYPPFCRPRQIRELMGVESQDDPRWTNSMMCRCNRCPASVGGPESNEYEMSRFQLHPRGTR